MLTSAKVGYVSFMNSSRSIEDVSFFHTLSWNQAPVA